MFLFADFNCQRRKDREALEENEKKMKCTMQWGYIVIQIQMIIQMMREIEQREKEEEINKGASF